MAQLRPHPVLISLALPPPRSAGGRAAQVQARDITVQGRRSAGGWRRRHRLLEPPSAQHRARVRFTERQRRRRVLFVELVCADPRRFVKGHGGAPCPGGDTRRSSATCKGYLSGLLTMAPPPQTDSC